MRRFFLVLLLVLTLPGVASAALVQACSTRDFEGVRFTVCPFDSNRAELRLVRSPTRGFAGLRSVLGASADKVLFALNAGMFDDNGAPVGLYIERGIERHPLNTANGDGNFYMKPNGVFFEDADGTLHIKTTTAYDVHGRAPRWATQSGPMLVIHGTLNPQITHDGPSRYIRNAVCLRDPHTAIFAISENLVSFGKLARFLHDTMNCREALYLDGAVSSLWLPSQSRMDNRTQLGPMAVVLQKK